MKKNASFVSFIFAAVLFGGLTGISVPAQAQDAPRAPRKIQLTPADVAAAKEATERLMTEIELLQEAL